MTRLPVIAPLAVFVMLYCGGCENTFTPFSETGDRAIVVSGFLNHNADSQFVRVQVVRRSISSSASLEDGLSVVLENLGSNSTAVLVDSIVTTDRGESAHLFFTTMPVEAGIPYRLIATSADGEQTIRGTSVPARGGFSIDSVRTTQFSINQTIRLGLPEIPSDLTVVYTVQVVGNPSPTVFELPYQDSAIRNETWIELDVRLENDRTIILDMLGLPADDGTTELLDVAVQYVRYSQEWEDDLSLSEDLNFFGSVATFSHSWQLSNRTLNDLGWAVP